MRILLSWKWRENDMAKVLRDAGHEVVYVIGLTEKPLREVVPNAVFHYKREAQRGIPAPGIDPNDFPPPGKNLIEKLYDVESLVLTMMNRREGNLSVDERRHIYYEHLRYWLGVLKKFQIETIVFDDTPHATNTFVLVSLANLLGIKSIIFQKIRLSDRFLVFNNWRMAGERIYKRYLELIEFPAPKLEDLSEDIQEVYKSFQKKEEKPLYELKPFMAKHESFKIGTFARKIINKFLVTLRALNENQLKNIIKVKLDKRKRIKLIRALTEEYNNIQSVPEWGEKFVYLGLHYQPERTTCPQGDIFVDQLLMAEYVANSLPPGWKLYVKEHPMQWRPERANAATFVRYPGYYKRISSLPNTKILPIDTPTLNLIDKCQVVATVTGSPALEAVMSGKPAIASGLPWYLGCPGIFGISSPEECKKALFEIAGGFSIDRGKVLCYLKAADEVSFHAYIQIKTMLATNSKLKLEESMNEIYKNLLLELKSK